MIGTLYFLALLSSTMAWGVCMAGLRSTVSSLPFEALRGKLICSIFISLFLDQHVGLWSKSRNETGGGSGDRCTCDAFLPSSTFPIKDLVVIEQTAAEISHKVELEMGKVLRHTRNTLLEDNLLQTDKENIFI